MRLRHGDSRRIKTEDGYLTSKEIYAETEESVMLFIREMAAKCYWLPFLFSMRKVSSNSSTACRPASVTEYLPVPLLENHP